MPRSACLVISSALNLIPIRYIVKVRIEGVLSSRYLDDNRSSPVRFAQWAVRRSELELTGQATEHAAAAFEPQSRLAVHDSSKLGRHLSAAAEEEKALR